MTLPTILLVAGASAQDVVKFELGESTVTLSAPDIVSLQEVPDNGAAAATSCPDVVSLQEVPDNGTAAASCPDIVGLQEVQDYAGLGDTVVLEGIVLTGKQAENLGEATEGSLDFSAGGLLEVREHILLGRQVGVPRATEPFGKVVLEATQASIREHILLGRTSVVVLAVEAEVIDIVPNGTADEGEWIEIWGAALGASAIPTGTLSLFPGKPICATCSSSER